MTTHDVAGFTGPAVTASEKPTIAFRNVSKAYKLYDRPHERLLDQIGLMKLMFWRKAEPYHLFHALHDVDITIRPGERIGIIGRNGAGKTTLLKLITGNFSPNVGTVEVNGTVQALMQLGLGFHPEFSGYENIKASLNYNGLTGKALKMALDDIVEFVELEEFLHQPVKTYSMGMQARLQFAVATAIQPDILIVDEVLGAGDAYFAGKCAHRMKRLAFSGCTLLLVSHSLGEVLRFCDRAIWMHQGKVRQDGPALEVVRAYEAYIETLAYKDKKEREALDSTVQSGDPAPSGAQDVMTSSWQKDLLSELLVGPEAHEDGQEKRWPGEKGLKINHIRILDGAGFVTGRVKSGDPLSFEIDIVAEEDGDFEFRLSILVMSMEGVGVTRNFSPYYKASLRAGELARVRLDLEKTIFAAGEFVFSAALFKRFDPADTSTAIRYDLLPRCFKFKIESRFASEPGLFHHPAKWSEEPQLTLTPQLAES